MAYEEITAEESRIRELQNEMRSLKIPQRTIDFQFRNLQNGNRSFQQSRIITQRVRRQLQSQIDASQIKIISLRRALFGEG